MAKNRIFTVGFDLPGDDFQYVEFDSDKTMLDADIILFEPTLGDVISNETYNGKRVLSEYSSFSVKQSLDHWRSEIAAAVDAGKLVIVYLAKPSVSYRYTGEKKFSGTGRSRVTTNLVAEVSSYEAVPNLRLVTPKSGEEIQIDQGAQYLSPYWSEFSTYSPYEVEIDGSFQQVLLRSRSGNRILGAAVRKNKGALLFLPPIRYDQKSFVRYDKKSDSSVWTKEALQFGKRLVAALSALDGELKQSGHATPSPNWTTESKFRLEAEGRLEAEISDCVADINALQTKKKNLEDELLQAGSLRRLLFEQGRPLEVAILEALALLGFDAQSFNDGDSEFDCVFVSVEGRCLGEAEGRDNRPINIAKFSQLERNLQEDFARDDVNQYAKGALFGNAFRLLPPSERDGFFTEKCLAAAKRTNVALIRTPDLFLPARYLRECPGDVEYAKQCRDAIFSAQGEVVAFPLPQVGDVNLVQVLEDRRPDALVDVVKPSEGVI